MSTHPLTRGRRALLAAATAAVVLVAAGCGDDAERTGATAGATRPPTSAPAQEWTYARSMSQRRSYIASAEVGGRIYTAGGMVGETGRALATFQRYTPRTDTWATLRPLPVPVRAGAAAVLGDTIYVTGGLSVDGASRHVWAYDVGRGSWRPAAPLPAPRFNHSAVALGGRIYVLGGYSDGGEHDDVFVYDPGADRWRRFGHLPEPNHAFGAVAFRGDIWAIGGRQGERVIADVWILDPATRRWRRGPAMPTPMELLGTAVAGAEIHAIWESTYQIYDARTGDWTDGPPLLVSRHALSVFAIDGVLYTVGGCTTALRDSPVVERRVLPS